MGGQACVFYGAAEFGRDCDIAILCEPKNLARLQGALDELHAQTIAVPPFAEQEAEREVDENYWAPLKRELEELRRMRR
jgi:hypothetical protein